VFLYILKVTWEKAPLGLIVGNNIKTDLKEIKYEEIDCIQLAQDRGHCWFFVNVVRNLWVA
jgi:hypothetical protein